MTKLIAMLVVVMGCGGVMGQKHVTLSTPVRGDHYNCNPTKGNPDSWTCDPDSKPLKCGKYQHEQNTPGFCNMGRCEPAHDYCAEDMHTVTEKEWQELMERVKKLENPKISTWTVSDGNSTHDCTIPPDDITKPCDKNQPSQKRRKP